VNSHKTLLENGVRNIKNDMKKRWR